MQETVQVVSETDPKLSRLLLRSAIFSVTGNVDMLATELAEIMMMGGDDIHFSGFNPTMSSIEFGRSAIKEIADGQAFYDYTKRVVTYSPNAISSPSRLRQRQDGSFIGAKDYDLRQILDDDEMLSDALSRGFINFNRVLTEIEGLVGDISQIGQVELQDRIMSAIKFLIKSGGFTFDDISAWRSNEICITSPIIAYPFANFDWRTSLETATLPDSSGNLSETYEELNPLDRNSPFPASIPAPGDYLQRVTAGIDISDGMKAYSVVDCLRDHGKKIIALSEETRIYEEGAVPRMLLGRSAFWKVGNELIDRNVLEYWTPIYASRRRFEGYKVTFYEIESSTYVTHTIMPEDYMGPFDDSPTDNYSVPSTRRTATAQEVHDYLGMVGKHPFIRQGKADQLFEYMYKEELEQMD